MQKEYKLANLDKAVRDEILLMALTYRLSKTNLMKMFHTTEEDINVLFRTNVKLENALYHLDKETKNEDEINSRVAYTHALEYWHERNRLLKQIQTMPEKKEELRKELKSLREQIDDTKVFNIIKSKKRDLSEEEWDMLSRYSLKYYLGNMEAEKQLQRRRTNIESHQELLAERDPIFSEKLDLLKKRNRQRGLEAIIDKESKQEKAQQELENITFKM